MRRIIFLFSLALLIGTGAKTYAGNMTQAWVEEQIRQISGYAGVCHPQESPDVCNGYVVRLYSNLVADMAREVFGLCARKKAGASECEANVRKLIQSGDEAMEAAITLQAQLHSDGKTPNGMSRPLLSRYYGLRGQVEALKALLPQ